MKKTQILSLFGLLLFAVMIPSLAHAGAYPELEKLVKAKDYKAAYTLAESMSDKEAGESEFDMLYGVAARETGHADIAGFAFERVIMKNPKSARAHYEKGRTLIKLSDFKGAKLALNTALKLKPSDSMKKNINDMMSIVDKALARQEKSSARLTATATLGYNSNTNSGPIELNETRVPGPPIGDGYSNLSANLNLKRNISKRDNLFFSFGNSNRLNFTSSKGNYSTVNGKIGLETAVGPLQLKIPFGAEIVISELLPSRFSVSLGADLSMAWEKIHRAALSAAFKANQTTNEANNLRLMEIYTLYGVKLYRNLIDLEGRAIYNPVVSIGNGGKIGPGVKDDYAGQLKMSYEFARLHLLKPEIKVSYFDFKAPPATGLTRRQDVNIAAKLGYEFRFTPNLTFGPSYFFVYNKSNQVKNTYLRHQVEVGLTLSI